MIKVKNIIIDNLCSIHFKVKEFDEDWISLSVRIGSLIGSIPYYFETQATKALYRIYRYVRHRCAIRFEVSSAFF